MYNAANIIESKGIKATANRILVFRQLQQASHPMSIAEIEDSLVTMDKASIFRVLELFAKNDIIHAIEDGSRSLKYEICRGNGEHTTSDHHAHFYCEQCGELQCLDQISVPEMNLPARFKLRLVNLMLKGLCPKCNPDN